MIAAQSVAAVVVALTRRDCDALYPLAVALIFGNLYAVTRSAAPEILALRAVDRSRLTVRV